MVAISKFTFYIPIFDYFKGSKLLVDFVLCKHTISKIVYFLCKPADKAPPVKEPLPIDKAREQEKGVEEVKKVDAEIKNIAGAEVVAMPVKSDPGNEGADTKSEIKSNADSNPEAKNSEIQDKTSDNQQDNVEVLHKKVCVRKL